MIIRRLISLFLSALLLAQSAGPAFAVNPPEKPFYKKAGWFDYASNTMRRVAELGEAGAYNYYKNPNPSPRNQYEKVNIHQANLNYLSDYQTSAEHRRAMQIRDAFLGAQDETPSEADASAPITEEDLDEIRSAVAELTAALNAAGHLYPVIAQAALEVAASLLPLNKQYGLYSPADIAALRRLYTQILNHKTQCSQGAGYRLFCEGRADALYGLSVIARNEEDARLIARALEQDVEEPLSARQLLVGVPALLSLGREALLEPVLAEAVDNEGETFWQQIDIFMVGYWINKIQFSRGRYLGNVSGLGVLPPQKAGAAQNNAWEEVARMLAGNGRPTAASAALLQKYGLGRCEAKWECTGTECRPDNVKLTCATLLPFLVGALSAGITDGATPSVRRAAGWVRLSPAAYVARAYFENVLGDVDAETEYRVDGLLHRVFTRELEAAENRRSAASRANHEIDLKIAPLAQRYRAYLTGEKSYFETAQGQYLPDSVRLSAEIAALEKQKTALPALPDAALRMYTRDDAVYKRKVVGQKVYSALSEAASMIDVGLGIYFTIALPVGVARWGMSLGRGFQAVRAGKITADARKLARLSMRLKKIRLGALIHGRKAAKTKLTHALATLQKNGSAFNPSAAPAPVVALNRPQRLLPAPRTNYGAVRSVKNSPHTPSAPAQKPLEGKQASGSQPARAVAMEIELEYPMEAFLPQAAALKPPLQTVKLDNWVEPALKRLRRQQLLVRYDAKRGLIEYVKKHTPQDKAHLADLTRDLADLRRQISRNSSASYAPLRMEEAAASLQELSGALERLRNNWAELGWNKTYFQHFPQTQAWQPALAQLRQARVWTNKFWDGKASFKEVFPMSPHALSSLQPSLWQETALPLLRHRAELLGRELKREVTAADKWRRRTVEKELRSVVREYDGWINQVDKELSYENILTAPMMRAQAQALWPRLYSPLKRFELWRLRKELSLTPELNASRALEIQMALERLQSPTRLPRAVLLWGPEVSSRNLFKPLGFRGRVFQEVSASEAVLKGFKAGKENVLFVDGHGRIQSADAAPKLGWFLFDQRLSTAERYSGLSDILQAVSKTKSAKTSIYLTSCHSGQAVEDFLKLHAAYPPLTRGVNLYTPTGRMQLAFGDLQTAAYPLNNTAQYLGNVMLRKITHNGDGLAGRAVVDGRVIDPLAISVQKLERAAAAAASAEKPALLQLKKELAALHNIAQAGDPYTLAYEMTRLEKLAPGSVSGMTWDATLFEKGFVDFGGAVSDFSRFDPKLPRAYLWGIQRDPYASTPVIHLKPQWVNYVAQTAQEAYQVPVSLRGYGSSVLGRAKPVKPASSQPLSFSVSVQGSAPMQLLRAKWDAAALPAPNEVRFLQRPELYLQILQDAAEYKRLAAESGLTQADKLFDLSYLESLVVEFTAALKSELKGPSGQAVIWKNRLEKAIRAADEAVYAEKRAWFTDRVISAPALRAKYDELAGQTGHYSALQKAELADLKNELFSDLHLGALKRLELQQRLTMLPWLNKQAPNSVFIWGADYGPLDIWARQTPMGFFRPEIFREEPFFGLFEKFKAGQENVLLAHLHGNASQQKWKGLLSRDMYDDLLGGTEHIGAEGLLRGIARSGSAHTSVYINGCFTGRLIDDVVCLLGENTQLGRKVDWFAPAARLQFSTPEKLPADVLRGTTREILFGKVLQRMYHNGDALGARVLMDGKEIYPLKLSVEKLAAQYKLTPAAQRPAICEELPLLLNLADASDAQTLHQALAAAEQSGLKLYNFSKWDPVLAEDEVLNFRLPALTGKATPFRWGVDRYRYLSKMTAPYVVLKPQWVSYVAKTAEEAFARAAGIEYTAPQARALLERVAKAKKPTELADMSSLRMRAAWRTAEQYGQMLREKWNTPKETGRMSDLTLGALIRDAQEYFTLEKTLKDAAAFYNKNLRGADEPLLQLSAAWGAQDVQLCLHHMWKPLAQWKERLEQKFGRRDLTADQQVKLKEQYISLINFEDALLPAYMKAWRAEETSATLPTLRERLRQIAASEKLNSAQLDEVRQLRDMLYRPHPLTEFEQAVVQVRLRQLPSLEPTPNSVWVVGDFVTNKQMVDFKTPFGFVPDILSRKPADYISMMLRRGEENVLLVDAHGYISQSGVWKGTLVRADAAAAALQKPKFTLSAEKLVDVIEKSGSAQTSVYLHSCCSGQIFADLKCLFQTRPAVKETTAWYTPTALMQEASCEVVPEHVFAGSVRGKLLGKLLLKIRHNGDGLGGRALINGQEVYPLKLSVQKLEREMAGAPASRRMVLQELRDDLDLLRQVADAQDGKTLYEALNALEARHAGLVENLQYVPSRVNVAFAKGPDYPKLFMWGKQYLPVDRSDAVPFVRLKPQWVDYVAKTAEEAFAHAAKDAPVAALQAADAFKKAKEVLSEQNLAAWRLRVQPAAALKLSTQEAQQLQQAGNAGRAHMQALLDKWTARGVESVDGLPQNQWAEALNDISDFVTWEGRTRAAHELLYDYARLAGAQAPALQAVKRGPNARLFNAHAGSALAKKYFDLLHAEKTALAAGDASALKKLQAQVEFAIRKYDGFVSETAAGENSALSSATALRRRLAVLEGEGALTHPLQRSELAALKQELYSALAFEPERLVQLQTRLASLPYLQAEPNTLFMLGDGYNALETWQRRVPVGFRPSSWLFKVPLDQAWKGLARGEENLLLVQVHGGISQKGIWKGTWIEQAGNPHPLSALTAQYFLEAASASGSARTSLYVHSCFGGKLFDELMFALGSATAPKMDIFVLAAKRQLLSAEVLKALSVKGAAHEKLFNKMLLHMRHNGNALAAAAFVDGKMLYPLQRTVQKLEQALGSAAPAERAALQVLHDDLKGLLRIADSVTEEELFLNVAKFYRRHPDRVHNFADWDSSVGGAARLYAPLPAESETVNSFRWGLDKTKYDGTSADVFITLKPEWVNEVAQTAEEIFKAAAK